MPRADYLLAGDDALIGQCDVDRYRASGPGGQHRNKTESAVRLRHKPSGVTAIGEDSRSQAGGTQEDSRSQEDGSTQAGRSEEDGGTQEDRRP